MHLYQVGNIRIRKAGREIKRNARHTTKAQNRESKATRQGMGNKEALQFVVRSLAPDIPCTH